MKVLLHFKGKVKNLREETGSADYEFVSKALHSLANLQIERIDFTRYSPRKQE